MNTANCQEIIPENFTYGFYGRLNSNFPSQVIVDVSEICNLACIHCSHPSFKKSSYYSAARLSLELNKKLVDEIRIDGAEICQYIRYTGSGEPLANKNLFEMLSYATENSGTFVALTSNGTLLDKTNAQNLISTKIDLLDVSLDAFHPETYSKIRVKGDLNKVIENLRFFISAKQQALSSTKLVVSFIEHPHNQSEIEDFKKFWENEGADSVVVRRLHSNAGSVDYLAKQLQSANSSQTRRPCLYPWERITINPRGELAFCPQDWTHGSALADLRTHTIKELWQGELYSKVRDSHLNNDFSNCQFCAKCPDWAQTRWPNMGKSYADLVANVKSSKI